MDALLKPLTKHFEFLGYTVTVQEDGWAFAEHPVRLNVLFKPTLLGVRLHCSLLLGKRNPDFSAWHPFLNRANDTSALSRFALALSGEHEWSVRVRALLPARYDRSTFALLLDAWQEDVAMLRDAPRPAEGDDALDVEREQEEDEESGPVVIN
jgi:hypothetical protein